MGMAAEEEQEDSGGCNAGTCFACTCFAIAVFAITLIVLAATSKDPVYSVTVTGIAGLDPTTSSNHPSSLLSPVFNLTVRIDNAGNRMDGAACIGRLSTASVSYGDAVLGSASVPEFCAKGGKVRERGVRAWAQNVDLPQFLRDQLAGELAAGEAAVDVKVTTPAEDRFGDTVFVCSQAKIRGGPAPCRKETVYPVVYHVGRKGSIG